MNNYHPQESSHTILKRSEMVKIKLLNFCRNGGCLKSIIYDALNCASLAFVMVVVKLIILRTTSVQKKPR